VEGGGCISQISIFTIQTFDASNDVEIRFSYQGNQSVSNRMIVRDNDDNSVIYDEIEVTFRLPHRLAGNVLANGRNYSAVIEAFDIYGNSTISAPVSFACLSSPVWIFSNIANDQVVRNSSAIIELAYHQET